MAEVSDKVFQMRVSEEFLRRLDDWRREQPDIPARAEAIRRLVDKSLPAARPTHTGTGLVSLARQHVPEAVDTLRQMASDESASPSVKKKATRLLAKHGLK